MNKNFPQTEAKVLNMHFPDKTLEAIAKYGCCAFTALWLTGDNAEGTSAICRLADEIGRGLESDCTVHWCDYILDLTGRRVRVEFRAIESLADLRDVKGRCAVRYDYHGKCHWVGVENCKIEYNSLIESVCVNKGKPTTARILYPSDIY